MACLRRLFLMSLLAVAACAETSLPPALTLPNDNPHPPLRCSGQTSLVLHDVTIYSPTDGVRVSGFCHVTLYDSHIVGNRFGVAVTKFGRITLYDSTIEGGRGWAFASGFGKVDVRGGEISGSTRINRYARIETDEHTKRLD